MSSSKQNHSGGSKIDYIGDVKSGFQKVTEEVANDILQFPDKYKQIDNQLVDISGTEEYRQYLHEKEIAERKILVFCGH